MLDTGVCISVESSFLKIARSRYVPNFIAGVGAGGAGIHFSYSWVDKIFLVRKAKSLSMRGLN